MLDNFGAQPPQRPESEQDHQPDDLQPRPFAHVGELWSRFEVSPTGAVGAIVVSATRVWRQWRMSGSLGLKDGGHSPECRLCRRFIHAAFALAGAAFAVVGCDSHGAVYTTCLPCFNVS